MMKVKIKKILSFTFAEQEDFSLEHRLFLSSIIVGALTAIVGSVVNAILSPSFIAIVIPFVLSFLLLAIFYFLRFKRVVEPFIIPAIVIASISISVIWIFNGGINGSNIMPAFVIFMLSLLSVSEKNKKYIALLFGTLLIIIYHIQLFRPDVIINFTHEKDRWLDSFITALYSAFFIFLIIKFVHRHYAIERQRAEDNERRFRSLSENSQDLIVRFDRLFRCVYVNPAGAMIQGMSSGHLVGKTIRDFGGYDDKQCNLWEELIKTVFETGQTAFVQLTTHSNESLLYHDWRLYPEFEDQNKVVHVLGVGRDITELKLAEKALAESEARFRALFEGAPDAVILADPNAGKIVDANNAACRMLARARSEIIGMSQSDLHPSYTQTYTKQTFELHLAEAAQKGYTKPVENVILRSDGREVPVEILAQVIQLGDKTVLMGTFRDISERKRVEKAIKISEQRYTAVFNSTTEAVFIDDALTGKMIDVNSTMLTMYGYDSKEEVLAGNIGDLSANIDPFTEEAAQHNIQKTIAEGPQTFEWLARRKNGSVFWIEMTLKKIDLGGTASILATGRDITRRKQTELVLKQTESNYRRLHESMRDCYARVNMQGEIVDANPSFQEMLGYSLDEMYSLKYTDITPAKWLENEEQIVKNEVMSLGYSGIYEKEYIRKDGTVFPVELRTYLLKDEAGNPSGMWAIVRDITKRKQAEQALYQSEKKFRELFEANSDGITIFKIGSNGSPADIIDLNENAARMIGYTKEEMLTMKLGDLEKDVTLEKIEQRKNDIISFGKTSFETQICHKNGRYIDVEINVILIGFDNQPILMNIVRDITTRKATEKQLLTYTEELGKLIADKDRFLSILAHDLKSPFNSILGLLDLLDTNIRTYDMGKVEKLISRINKSAKNTYNLLDSLLIWIRSQSGSIPYNPQLINFNAVYKETIDILQPNAFDKNISITRHTGNSLTLFADIDMLKTILRNLISNSIKFSHTDGKIDISGKEIDNEVLISVSDNGVGMSDETLHNLFNISKIQSMPGTANEHGTGLGLLLCKEFVEKHAGRIWVESEEGKGSVFSFSIPVMK